MRIFKKPANFDLAQWLQQGMSPRRLALTLALGFAIGCIPVVGVPTVLCAALALMLKLNQPAIQAANYVAMPLQLLLIVPFMRLGKWLFVLSNLDDRFSMWLRHSLVAGPAVKASGLASEALLGWMMVAVPAVMLMWLTFTVMLRKIPAIAAAESGD